MIETEASFARIVLDARLPLRVGLAARITVQWSGVSQPGSRNARGAQGTVTVSHWQAELAVNREPAAERQRQRVQVPTGTRPLRPQRPRHHTHSCDKHQNKNFFVEQEVEREQGGVGGAGTHQTTERTWRGAENKMDLETATGQARTDTKPVMAWQNKQPPHHSVLQACARTSLERRHLSPV